MGFADVGQGAASVVYLVLYIALALALAYALATRRPKIRFLGLSIFAAIRIGSQIAGICFAVLSYSSFSSLIAYFVLGAEGYFALVLTSLYALIGYQKLHFGSSWLHHEVTKEEEPVRLKRRIKQLSQPSAIFHLALIPANVLTIIGGTSQSASDGIDYANNPNVTRGRILRCIGQATFLVLTIIFLSLVASTVRQSRREGVRDVAPLYLLLATAPFFIVRGIFGILSSALVSLSYYNPQNYDEDGLSTRVLVVDYVLGTTMEFIVACLVFSAALILTRPKGEQPPRPDAAQAEREPDDGDVKSAP